MVFGLECLSGACPQREVRKYRTGAEPGGQILTLHEIGLLERPATSRLRLKWIAPTPLNAPGRIVCVSGNAPYPDRLVNAVSQTLDIRLYCRPES
jgi:hypothetical protein